MQVFCVNMKDQVLKMWGLIVIVVIFSTQCMAADEASCAKSPCQNKGVCSVKDKAVVCTCEKGYGGDRCEVADQASCAKNPCQNKGVCSVKDKSVVCTCEKGYGGDRCEDTPDCFEDKDCLEGVSCWTGETPYTCAGTKMSVHILLVTFVAVLAVMNLN